MISSNTLTLILGAIIGFGFSILLETLKNPKLHIVLGEEAPIRTYTDRPAKKAKFLSVKLWNRPQTALGKVLNKAIRLRAAHSCTGEIQFHHLEDGQPVLSKPMRLRWSGSADATMQILGDDDLPKGMVIDPERINSSYFRTCYPDRVETIDIAVKFDDEENCYGWTTENMLGDRNWRPTEYRLSPGRYLVDIVVRTEATSIHKIFLLDNTVSIENFRLQEATVEDQQKIENFKPRTTQ